MIEAHDATISIGAKRIVANVDFIAPAGELAAIVGPNGSGKTTLPQGAGRRPRLRRQHRR